MGKPFNQILKHMAKSVEHMRRPAPTRLEHMKEAKNQNEGSLNHMDCLDCGNPLVMTPLDHCAAYTDYVERYVACAHCNYTTVIRYNKPEFVCTYEKVRRENGDNRGGN